MSDFSLISSITIKPAYGKDYATRQDVIDAWFDNKDFLIESMDRPIKTGRYISLFDVITYSPKAEVIYTYKSFGIVLREGRNDNVY